MSDYPMLISNKLHSFRNFFLQKYKYIFNSGHWRQKVKPYIFSSPFSDPFSRSCTSQVRYAPYRDKKQLHKRSLELLKSP